jgi:hypothetical protein
MTTQQMLITLAIYTIALFATVYFTKPSWRRTVGALVGGATGGMVLLCGFFLGTKQELWHSTTPTSPGILVLFYLATAVSCAPVYLITWRVALRFGLRGLVVFLLLSALVGPPRDYFIASIYPEWISFSPGVAPLLAVSTIYFGIVGLGHAGMWIIAGPARKNCTG